MDSAAAEVDGSAMEGGGQILRVSAALSCITGTSVKISKIRAGRSSPGLRPQHLSGLQLVSDLCGGGLQGASIGSTDISLTPGKIQGGAHTADPQTAGSVCLLLQVALPCALYADGPSQLCLKGGTNAEMAPQIDYTVKVFKPIVERFGVHFDCDIKMRGYYPKGGGEVMVTVNPVKELQPVVMTERGNITKIYGRAFVAGVLPYKLPALRPQLVIFMALAKGTSRIRTGAVTLHTQTAIAIATQLTQAKFTITKCEDELSSEESFIIECEGSGAANTHL
ncbi:RNA 3'-terminal phosphate cyclase [Etheostoma cragini]|uniref:RNA 3'-terminal phosphate cyclase n=1 Tax=Etheostoma cragini TaxID=417921 RepID=UPI00155EED52|nr:RNA 3'-terminal phosphate cyclase [Etheostoma cragini]